MAILSNYEHMGGYAFRGTLNRVPLSGGAARPILEDVGDAGWSPNGSDLAVTHYMPASDTWRLEYPIGKVLYETHGWIDAPRVSADGDAVAFLDHPTSDGDNRGTVAVVDLSGRKKTLTQTWTAESGLAWVPSGKELWFAAAQTGSIRSLWAVSRSGKLRPLERGPADLILQDVSRQGRALVQQNSSHFVLRALGSGQTHERQLDWLDWSLPRQISPDGKLVLFEEEGEGGGPGYTVYIRATDGSPAVGLGHGAAVALSPDLKWVLTRPLGADPAPFILLPAGAGQPQQITHDQINHSEGSWFPDGKRILFAGNEPGHNVRDYVLDVETGQSRPLTPEGIFGTELSPDGTTIVLRKPDGSWVLWPVEGGEPRSVPTLNKREFVTQWTSDGRAVYFYSSDRDESFPKIKMYILDLQTGNRRLAGSYGPADLTGIGGFVPAMFSRDGKSYLYGYVLTQSELFVVDDLN